MYKAKESDAVPSNISVYCKAVWKLCMQESPELKKEIVSSFSWTPSSENE